jgi:hypothetical protein
MGMKARDFISGNLLYDKPELRYEIRDGDETRGYHHDIVYAMAWAKAAKSHGVWCDVLDGEAS